MRQGGNHSQNVLPRHQQYLLREKNPCGKIKYQEENLWIQYR